MIHRLEKQLARLIKVEDALEKINAEVDWQSLYFMIRWIREMDYSLGRLPWDEITLFKATLLQDWNNLSDEETEYMINDRLTFRRFLGLDFWEQAPDKKAMRLFKEQMGEGGMKELFEMFEWQMESIGLMKREGILVDVMFAEPPNQRYLRGKSAKIKRAAVV